MFSFRKFLGVFTVFAGVAGVSVLPAFSQDSSEGESPVEVNLYVTIEAEKFEKTVSEFDARNVEVILSGQLNSRLSGFAEIEFERSKAAGKVHTSTSTVDVDCGGVVDGCTVVDGVSDNGDSLGAIEVEQGWAQFKIANWLNIQSGVILVPFGRFNMEHFDPYRDLTDRPILARRVIPTTWAEAGTGALGSFYLGDSLTVDYRAYVFNGATDDISDRGMRGARGTFGADNNNNKATAGQLTLSAFNSRVGGSFYRARYNAAGDKIFGWNVDANATLGPLEVLGEFARFSLDDGLNASGVAAPSYLSGGYAQANLHFWFDFLNNTFLGKNLLDPTFTAVVRWGFGNNDDDGDNGSVMNGSNYEKRTTIGFNYRPSETFVYKFEYQNNRTTNEKLERGDNNGFIGSVSAAF